MSPEPVAAERTYHSLKRDILTGRHRPGAALNLQRLADEHGISVSPVRDAIHRLVGERLVQVSPGGGFQTIVPTARDLHNLYSWNEQVLRHALRQPAQDVAAGIALPIEATGDDAGDLAAATASFFGALAIASGNAEIIHAVASVSDRLSLVRSRESLNIKGMGHEIEGLINLARNGRAAALRTALREYHRRRLRRVERLVAAVLI